MGKGGDDRSGATGSQAESGGGVNEVGVFFFADLDVLVEVSGGGDGAVFKKHGLRGSELEGAKRNAPAFLVGRGITEAEISGGGDEGLGISGLLQVVEDEVGGVTFGDASEVKLHAIEGQGGGLVFGIE